MLLLHLSDVDEASWGEKLKAALAPYPVVRREDAYDPADIRYIFVWKPKPEAFDGLTDGEKAAIDQALPATAQAKPKHSINQSL